MARPTPTETPTPAPAPIYRIPEELRETRLDFTIAYLLARPPNLPAFSLAFFQRLKETKDAIGRGQHKSRKPAGHGLQSIPTDTTSDEGNDFELDEGFLNFVNQFTIVYIVERPASLIEFGIRYSNKKLLHFEAEQNEEEEDEHEHEHEKGKVVKGKVTLQ